jgi:hypothetical protein
VQTRKQFLLHWNQLGETYCDEVERSQEYLGVKRGGGKKRADIGGAERHFAWLAGYQVCGWPRSEIAKAVGEHGIHRAAVYHALPQVAERIGLSLRPAEAANSKWTAPRIRARLNSLVI